MPRLMRCSILLIGIALIPLQLSASVLVHLEWGVQSAQAREFYFQLQGENLSIGNPKPIELEDGESITSSIWQTQAGNSNTDAVEFELTFSDAKIQPIENLHSLWKNYFELSDPDTVQRLKQDPAYRPDARKLTVQMNAEGTQGFSLTVDQLLQNRTFWIPSLDVYLTIENPAVPMEEYLNTLQPQKEKRVLRRIPQEPEASYEQFTVLWEDMGGADYKHPNQPAPGHIVGLTWDSAVAKFGVDRGAGVWNDYGNPDRFRLWYSFGELDILKDTWKGQSLQDGLPIVTTNLEHEGIRYTVEQFAYPLADPPQERRGDMEMALLQKVRILNCTPQTKNAVFQLHHRRQFPKESSHQVQTHSNNGNTTVLDEGNDRVMLAVRGHDFNMSGHVITPEERSSDANKKEEWLTLSWDLKLDLESGQEKELYVYLPSPALPISQRESLLSLNYSEARSATLHFWSDNLAHGAQFSVPEEVVNDLFRASLWHSLRLPRRHGGMEEDVQIDLPYSNFAYDQNGTPWPVNQAVYVDYMIYGLRGYHGIAEEELLTMFRNNQEADGHVKGYANWGVYTPSMIYTVAQHYLLSHDRAALEHMLPYTLKAMDWCLKEIQKSAQEEGIAKGLVRAPLNDLTGEGVWAFNQAYIYAGLDLLGQVLREIDHPRSEECLSAAHDFRASVELVFGAASMRSPLIQLRDQTWIPYVPCEALTPRRMLEQWYPTDVDTGAVHLLRLGALPAEGLLAESLLNDQEDNLFLHGWGMMNEPVYNPQATVYLTRDEPEAVIRTFYSYMACAFSHSALEPVEHRWSWGQYFGPPSTDGAWFELYRNMLIREWKEDTLFLLQATPRKWLEDGKRIEIERAPTHYGDISLTMESQALEGKLRVDVDMPAIHTPKTLQVRLRHPQAKRMKSVLVNNAEWKDFDPEKEWVRIPNPDQRRYTIEARY